MSEYYELDINTQPPLKNVTQPYQPLEPKLDHILSLVRDIDQRLKNHFEPPAPLPRNVQGQLSTNKTTVNRYSRPPSRLPTTLPIPSNQAKNVSYANVPPPRPPKTPEVIRPKVNCDGSVTFTSSQCLCLILQLKGVRMFIDENFDDDYVDKEINIACMDSAIRTLNNQKH